MAFSGLHCMGLWVSFHLLLGFIYLLGVTRRDIVYLSVVSFAVQANEGMLDGMFLLD